MTMLKFFTLTVFVMVFSHICIAQETEVKAISYTEVNTDEEEKNKLNLSGSADIYYRANLNAKNNPSVSYPIPSTSFANGAGFSLGMFNLIGAYNKDKVGIVADLVFGPRGTEAVFGSFPSNNILNQLYVYWNANKYITLTMGNFNTFLGYEVISPTSNFNYSTSYMFSYGPFSHTGLKMDIGLSDQLSLMLGVFNPTDITETNFSNTYTLGSQLSYSGESYNIYLNLLFGDQDGTLDKDFIEEGMTSAGNTFQIDVTAGFDITKQFFVGLNMTCNTTNAGEVVRGNSIEDIEEDPSDFYGFAGYFQYTISEVLMMGLRGEYFKEANFGAGAIGTYDLTGDASILAVTVSANVKIDNLTLIPELRLDNASEDATFLDAELMPSKSLASFLLAAVYKF